MTTDELLMFEKYSAFDHGLWDRDEWCTLLNYSQGLEEVHNNDLAEYGYSFVQDSYYALRGNTPNDSLLGVIWNKVMGASSYQTLPPLLTDVNQTVTTVSWLAEKMRKEYSYTVHSNKDQLLDPVDANNPPFIPDAPELGDQGDLQGMLAVDKCLWALFDGTPKDKRELADSTNKFFDLKGITKFLGWAKNTVGGAARMGKSVAGQLTGYKGGGWSSNVHPREMLELAKGSPMAQINMAENNLTTRQYQTALPQGRGGVILLRDVSGSMLESDYADPATRLQTSVSIEVALALAFNGENRDLISILWSSRTCKKYIYGEPGWKNHVSFRPYPSDSTLIDKALKEAIDTAAKYAPNSDICILTDGFLDNHASTTNWERFDKMLQPFRDRGGKVWAIIMTTNATADQLRCWGWVDGYVTTETLSNVDNMTSIIAAMAQPRGNEQTKRLI